MSNNVPNDQKLTVEEINTFQPSTERERFSFDLGYEEGARKAGYDDGWNDGWKARLDPQGIDWSNLAEVREVLQAMVAGLDEAIAKKRAKVDR